MKNKLLLAFIIGFAFLPLQAMHDEGMGELQIFGSESNREQEVEALIPQFLAGDTVASEHRDLLKKYLLAFTQDEYQLLIARITARHPDKHEKDDLVKALFAIVEKLDTQNEILKQQFQEYNQGQDEGDKLNRKQFRFTKYSWKVGTVLGVLGTFIGGGIAIWQGILASEATEEASQRQ